MSTYQADDTRYDAMDYRPSGAAACAFPRFPSGYGRTSATRTLREYDVVIYATADPSNRHPSGAREVPLHELRARDRDLGGLV